MKSHYPQRRLCLNEDNGHAYAYMAPEHTSEASLRHLVDLYACDTQIGQIVFCVNVQRALFDSRAWQPFFDGYDPTGPDDQPMFQWILDLDRNTPGARTVFRERRMVHCLWLLAQRNIDQFAVWLDQCRKRQVEGWLSIRMNDSHYTHEPRCHWHNRFWLEHPEWHLDAGRRPGPAGFDFSHQAVRDHYLALARELFERYDMDGLELDWMRWGFVLALGQERARSRVITDFMTEIRALSTICSQRTGRPVRLGARVPGDLQSCLSLGYDVVDWIQSGLIDQIVPSSFYAHQWLDYPLETWRAIIGDRPVDLSPCLYAEIADPNTGKALPDSPATYRGASGAALARGADQIYLFNTCYRADQFHAPENPEIEDRFCTDGRIDHYIKHIRQPRNDSLREILTTCGSLQTISGRSRRHVLTDQQFVVPGWAAGRRIPGDLSGRWAHLRFHAGPTPKPEEQPLVLLGFDRKAGQSQAAIGGDPLGQAALWLNGTRCMPAQPPADSEPITPEAACVRAWAVDPAVIYPGENLITYQAPTLEGRLVWAEFDILPAAISATRPM